ncbi:MAG: hypothetical protein IKE01_04240 [Clostridia bacterium]|nr:hypothetical protein [Clostridia bacterium]MBR3152510.1 hypothetical protein [Clostridia bacterium]
MTLLKIENNEGKFSIDGENFIEIEKISKDDILKIFEKVLDENSVTIEKSNEDDKKINSPAQKIIYDNIYDKINGIIKEKDDIKSFDEDEYYIAMNKYKEAE